MIIADTSGLLALLNRREPAHEAVSRLVKSRSDLLVVSPYVVAELDYLVATRLGTDAEIAMLNELASGAYELTAMPIESVRAAAEIVDTYCDQDVGITDASLVVLAHRFETTELLTLDHRHFSVLRPLGGGHFTLLPEDQS